MKHFIRAHSYNVFLQITSTDSKGKNSTTGLNNLITFKPTHEQMDLIEHRATRMPPATNALGNGIRPPTNYRNSLHARVVQFFGNNHIRLI
jgi:hypothetical protein